MNNDRPKINGHLVSGDFELKIGLDLRRKYLTPNNDGPKIIGYLVSSDFELKIGLDLRKDIWQRPTDWSTLSVTKSSSSMVTEL